MVAAFAAGEVPSPSTDWGFLAKAGVTLTSHFLSYKMGTWFLFLSSFPREGNPHRSTPTSFPRLQTQTNSLYV